MKRRTERICYLVILTILVAFLGFDWYDRGWSPPNADSSREQSKAPVREDPIVNTKEPANHEFDNPESEVDSPLALDWLEQSDPLEWEEFESLSAEQDIPRLDRPSRQDLTEEEIDRYYDRLAQRKFRPREVRKLVDYEKTRGEKPDWMVMEEWRNRLRLENYKNPGPVYTSSYTDVYGNRHRSFEDRSGRIDVFNTWGREYRYFQPK